MVSAKMLIARDYTRGRAAFIADAVATPLPSPSFVIPAERSERRDPPSRRMGGAPLIPFQRRINGSRRKAGMTNEYVASGE
jgi:hypothetical protein